MPSSEESGAPDLNENHRRKIDRTIRELQAFVRGGPEEDFAERLSRLGRTAAEPELFALLERVLREHGLVEFRRTFAALRRGERSAAKVRADLAALERFRDQPVIAIGASDGDARA